MSTVAWMVVMSAGTAAAFTGAGSILALLPLSRRGHTLAPDAARAMRVGMRVGPMMREVLTCVCVRVQVCERV